jgi:ubiquinone biosynthesis UbiH/UbiF/VisC/COQ6 family hydroxylase
MHAQTDILIIGAGPSGLCLASALAKTGLNITVLERQSLGSIAHPAFDGREIALTHHSVQWLKDLGVWQHIPAQAISRLRDARVFNGSSLLSLNIGHDLSNKSELGYLVANHEIRLAAYAVAASHASITIQTDLQVQHIQQQDAGVRVTLSNHNTITSQLLIAADSRFSETRRAMGIAADMHDFGKTMLVCVMVHTKDHQQTAWEWFDYGQTLALLPMNGSLSSVVITLAPDEMSELMQLTEPAFNQELTARFKHRLGAMRLVSTRHTYPLVTAYAKRLVGPRFALVGDAAVGMHPVTAHGFNFGVSGIACLAGEIQAALNKQQDIASDRLLRRYEQAHRRHTKPLFLATHAIAKLYASNSLPARLLRAGAIRIGNRISPFKRAVAGFLADAR